MNRYPSIVPLDGRPVPGVSDEILAELLEAAEDVRARTGFVGWYHTRRQTIIWIMGADPRNGGAHEEPIFQRGRYLRVDTDRTCRIIRLAKKSIAEQDAEMAKAEFNRVSEMMQAIRRRAENMGPELQSRMRHFVRRVEDGRHSRPSVLVP